LVHGFDRPNLVLGVQRFVESADKDAAVLTHATALSTGGASGIIYVSTRQRTEILAAELEQREIPAAAYHAGLPRHRRSAIHEQFMDGSCGVIVATSAFGMGIDKPDVRFVLHADIAESLDAHYQEIGRAGRDGAQADTILFYRPEDLSIHRFFGGASLPEGEIRKVAGVLVDTHAPRNIDALATTLEMSRRRITNIVNKLEAVGALKVTRGGALRVAPEALINAAEKAIRLEEDRNRWQASRIEMMRDYAETTDCRRRVLLTYFGETVSGPCARCDNCHTGRSQAHDEDRTGEYQPGAPVSHREWGPGRVLRNNGDQLVVLFETVGYKALSLSLLKKGNLLQDGQSSDDDAAFAHGTEDAR
jgi:ATP-dependent DNA helicase RecQ